MLTLKSILIILCWLFAISAGQTVGDLRLVSDDGRVNASSGRLEVYYNGQWGTVCDDAFGQTEADSACRQLGFTAATVFGDLGFKQASSNVRTWLDDVNCISSSIHLINCTHNPFGTENCGHNEDISLHCSAPSNGNLRLVNYDGHTGSAYGRLEFYYGGQWGTVCNDFFGSTEANVACQQLGYPVANNHGTVGRLGVRSAPSGTQILLDDVDCSSTNTRLVDCRHSPVGQHNCGHNEDVALVCAVSQPDPMQPDSGGTSTTGVIIGSVVAVIVIIAIPIVIFIIVCVVCLCGVASVASTRSSKPNVVTVSAQPTTTDINKKWFDADHHIASYTAQPTVSAAQPQQTTAPYPTGSQQVSFPAAPQQPPAPYPI